MNEIPIFKRTHEVIRQLESTYNGIFASLVFDKTILPSVSELKFTIETIKKYLIK